MEGTYAPEMPYRQLGFALSRMDKRSACADELLQQRIHGDALSPRFFCKASFGFARNFDTHETALSSENITYYSRP